MLEVFSTKHENDCSDISLQNRFHTFIHIDKMPNIVVRVATHTLVILVECVAIDTLEIFGTKWLTNNLPHIVTHIAKVVTSTFTTIWYTDLLFPSVPYQMYSRSTKFIDLFE